MMRRHRLLWIDYGMRCSLFSPSKFAARIAWCSVVVGVLSAPMAGYAGTLETTPSETAITLNQKVITGSTNLSDKVLIAHCGLEGCPISASQLLSTSNSKIDQAPGLSDSLWSNLVLSMALQRDSEVQALTKKLGRVDSLTLVSVAAISALGLAQGLDTLSTIEQDPHPKHPAVIGIIGSSASLASLGGRVFFSYRYRKQLEARQLAIKSQVEAIITHYESGNPTESDKIALVTLIGERATQEFIGLWETKHLSQK